MDTDVRATQPQTLSLAGLAALFLRFGALAWGGPVAQIAMLQRELVDRQKWISRARFNRTLAVYQVLPGPEAQELAIFFGMLARGRIGGFVAGLCFLLPGFLLMLVLASIHVGIGAASPILASASAGVQACALALIARGVHRIGTRVITSATLLVIAAAAMVLTLAGMPFAVPLLLGAMVHVGVVRSGRTWPVWMLAAVVVVTLSTSLGPPTRAPMVEPDSGADAVESTSVPDLFLSGLRAGSLTFGGAYTAIPFLEEDAVGDAGWLTRDEFLEGLAIAALIPAPLVIFATWLGYLGGGLAGAAAITVGMFLPAFAMTLLGHGVLEAVVQNERMHAALDGITAAVIGLVLAAIIGLAPVAISSPATLGVFAAAAIGFFVWRSLVAAPVLIGLSALVGIATA
jgi:chromate transporter